MQNSSKWTLFRVSILYTAFCNNICNNNSRMSPNLGVKLIVFQPSLASLILYSLLSILHIGWMQCALHMFAPQAHIARKTCSMLITWISASIGCRRRQMARHRHFMPKKVRADRRWLPMNILSLWEWNGLLQSKFLEADKCVLLAYQYNFALVIYSEYWNVIIVYNMYETWSNSIHLPTLGIDRCTPFIAAVVNRKMCQKLPN